MDSNFYPKAFRQDIQDIFYLSQFPDETEKFNPLRGKNLKSTLLYIKNGYLMPNDNYFKSN